MKFVVIDSCPVPAEIAEQVKALKHDVPSAVLQSAYRGDQAAGLLKRLGKSTQAMLYNGWLRRLPGFNPANPPGRSTHELRSDGVPYRGPIGRPIRAWGCGLDFNDGAIPALIQAAHRRGWDLFQPYHSGSEFHHLNFRRKPKLKARPKPVKPKPVKASATKISPAGTHLIASFEGFRSKPYKDAVGVPTIGYGHTAGVTMSSKPLTEPQALALLRKDLNRVYAPPVAKVAKQIGLRLNQNQFDALVSAIYNLGPGVLSSGRTLGDALRSKDRHRIADAFLVYDKAGNPPRALPGLTRRRHAERDLYLKVNG